MNKEMAFSNVFAFVAALSAGILIIYLTTPGPAVVVKSPCPFTEDIFMRKDAAPSFDPRRSQAPSIEVHTAFGAEA